MTPTAAASAVVVVGAGPAGHRLVERLRHHGHHGPVTLLGAEPVPPYNRALLTSVLDGTLTPDALALPRLPGDTRLLTGVTVRRLDRLRRLVHTDDGAAHPYDVLVLATGARPRHPGAPRTLTGTPAPTSRPGPAAVVGGGVHGVETALALCRAGRPVTLVHPGPYPLGRFLDATAGALLAGRLAADGITLVPGRRAVVQRGGAPAGLVLDDGGTVPASTVLHCTGAAPRTRLARAAGLAVRRGVLVDDTLRTDDPRVHALGDCAEHDGRVLAGLLAAFDQADVVARIVTGGPARYRPAPVQLRLKAPGLDLAVLGPPGATGDETVVCADPARARYARLVLRAGRVAGAQLLGLPHAVAALTRLHDHALPVPEGRLDLLLGRPADTGAAPVDLPGTAVVCVCNGVTKDALLAACRGGARDLPALAAATRATTGCGGCASDVRRICGAPPTPAAA
ncbi:FAD-dependent oxidoreductase [Streptomyces sp. NPDC048290]|uniref:FAD-dependent oxidoreductase n=1 Tax=Streptomyces sp. NPDC048290 TaxID=3155811 RepID=UPI0034345F9C